MTEIDPVSRILGNLERAAQDAEKHRLAMDNKLDQVLLLVPTVTKLAETISDQEDLIKKNTEKIRNIELFHAKVLGIATGISAATGTVTALAFKFIPVWLK